MMVAVKSKVKNFTRSTKLGSQLEKVIKFVSYNTSDHYGFAELIEVTFFVWIERAQLRQLCFKKLSKVLLGFMSFQRK